jgi:phosphorylcholine metabolism protein LicD
MSSIQLTVANNTLNISINIAELLNKGSINISLNNQLNQWDKYINENIFPRGNFPLIGKIKHGHFLLFHHLSDCSASREI